MDTEQRKKLFKLPQGTQRLVVDMPADLKHKVDEVAASKGMHTAAFVREVLAREVNNG